jgi:hypothetical protein
MAPAFQADDEGSIPFTRSNVFNGLDETCASHDAGGKRMGSTGKPAHALKREAPRNTSGVARVRSKLFHSCWSIPSAKICTCRHAASGSAKYAREQPRRQRRTAENLGAAAGEVLPALAQVKPQAAYRLHAVDPSSAAIGARVVRRAVVDRSSHSIWWRRRMRRRRARRPLAACRAVIFSQLVDDPSSWPDETLISCSEARGAWRCRGAIVLELMSSFLKAGAMLFKIWKMPGMDVP